MVISSNKKVKDQLKIEKNIVKIIEKITTNFISRNLKEELEEVSWLFIKTKGKITKNELSLSEFNFSLSELIKKRVFLDLIQGEIHFISNEELEVQMIKTKEISKYFELLNNEELTALFLKSIVVKELSFFKYKKLLLNKEKTVSKLAMLIQNKLKKLLDDILYSDGFFKKEFFESFKLCNYNVEIEQPFFFEEKDLVLILNLKE